MMGGRSREDFLKELSTEIDELCLMYAKHEVGRVGAVANRIAQLVAEYVALENGAEEALP